MRHHVCTLLTSSAVLSFTWSTHQDFTSLTLHSGLWILPWLPLGLLTLNLSPHSEQQQAHSCFVLYLWPFWTSTFFSLEKKSNRATAMFLTLQFSEWQWNIFSSSIRASCLVEGHVVRAVEWGKLVFFNGLVMLFADTSSIWVITHTHFWETICSVI